MYEIDVCYKIIFEAMLEENALEKIADRISKYTAAEVIFVSGAGKILAYSHACENGKRECIQQKAYYAEKNMNITGNMGMTEKDS